MSKTITYKDLEGNTHTITTVNRAFGLFAVFNNDSSSQVPLGEVKEEDYHECIKDIILKNGGTIV